MTLTDIRNRIAEWVRPRNATEVSNVTPAEFARLLDSWGVGVGAAGIVVTPETASRAIPVKACCTLIAGGVLSLPLRILQREFSGGTLIARPTDDHPYWWLFNEAPNPDSTSARLWQQVVWDVLLRGRAYARIVRRRGSADVVAIYYHRHCEVTPEIRWDPAHQVRRIASYTVTQDGRTFGVMPDDMLDFRGEEAQKWVGIDGASAILEATRESIGILLAIEQFAGRAFSNGGTPRNVIEYPTGVAPTQEQQNMLRDAWVRKYGGVENSHVPLILTNGGKTSKLSLTAQELQMSEQWKQGVVSVATGFNVPPFMIGETEKTSSWGSGIEQMSKGFVRYTLGPTLTVFEQEINRKIFGIARYAVDFDEEALDRGDMKSIGEWFRQAVGGSQGPGFMTVNEIRARLKLPPIDGGEELYEPKNGGDKNAPDKLEQPEEAVPQ